MTRVKTHCLLAVLAIAGVLSTFGICRPLRPGISRENAFRIQPGMRFKEVQAILGSDCYWPCSDHLVYIWVGETVTILVGFDEDWRVDGTACVYGDGSTEMIPARSSYWSELRDSLWRLVLR